MYSKEEREKAIKLYIKYDKCAADVIHITRRVERWVHQRQIQDYQNKLSC